MLSNKFLALIAAFSEASNSSFFWLLTSVFCLLDSIISLIFSTTSLDTWLWVKLFQIPLKASFNLSKKLIPFSLESLLDISSKNSLNLG